MLRITQNKSAEGATKYFDEGLAKSDYYAEKGEIIGKWGGRGAELLGLSGEVTRDEFHDLCYNIDPNTGNQLTAKNRANRTVGYDFTFDVPKSVSIVYSQTKDKEILVAFNKAVRATMKELESNMETRVRVGGKSENRISGNLVYGSFIHEEARPVGGVPDPHLHQHVFVFNATYDKQEEKWKAGQFRNVKADGQYYESIYHSRLADQLEKIGYSVQRTKNGFELIDFERPIIEKFSNRTKQVEKAALELGLNSAQQKGEVGARTRASKRKGLDREALRLEWKSRLTKEEQALVFNAKNNSNSDDDRFSPEQAIDYSIKHCLERKSVVGKKELMIHALKRSYGSATPEQLVAAINGREDLLSKITENGRVYTTQKALKEEKQLIHASRKGKGAFKVIHSNYQIKNELLSEEQQKAVHHALENKDFVSIITGGAGTGKTWSIKEVALGVREAGLSFSAFAPSASASRGVQREDGFENATTIAALLQSKKLQEQTKDGVIWIDEAGMVGNSTMNRIMRVAKEQNARLLLTGDTRQHGAVERGDALRIMQKYGGVQPAYISKIQRQKVGDYKKAVKQISEGDIEKGYEALNVMGAIKEHEELGDNLKALSSEYLEATKAKESVLVVATTHKQGKLITDALRAEMKEQNLLGAKAKAFEIQRNLSYTQAKKQDALNYEEGMSIQFHQHVKGFKRGGKYQITGKDENGNITLTQIDTKNKNSSSATQKNRLAAEKKKEVNLVLPLNQAKKFSVYTSETIELAKGDKIRITQNGFSKEKKRLNNGKVLEVKGFTENGNIIASTGKMEVELDKNYRNLTHGYYTTSPASQGKSVNRVLILQTASSGKASNKEQFYVSASRGKFAISVYTDDKQQLLQSVQRSSQRMTAIDVANTKNEAAISKDVVSIQNKLKKINQIAIAGLSKSSNMWKKGREMMNFDVKSTNAKPIKYAPVKGK